MTALLYAALVCFAAAGMLGLALLSYVMRGVSTPKGLALLHGPLAALGIVLLLIYWATTPEAPVLALLVVVAAAAGGFFLLYRDLVHGRVPRPFALAHGTLAVAALVLLLQFLLTRA